MCVARWQQQRICLYVCMYTHEHIYANNLSASLTIAVSRINLEIQMISLCIQTCCMQFDLSAPRKKNAYHEYLILTLTPTFVFIKRKIEKCVRWKNSRAHDRSAYSNARETLLSRVQMQTSIHLSMWFDIYMWFDVQYVQYMIKCTWDSFVSSAKANIECKSKHTYTHTWISRHK